mgnify:CR=1 FL=1
MANWMASTKNEHSINRVATQLGMRSERGKEYGPCISCGAKKRGATDKRLPIGVTRSEKGEYWRCYACGIHGDVMDLVAYSLHGVRCAEVDDYRAIREFFDLNDFATDEIEIPTKNAVEYPPIEDIKKLKAALDNTTIAHFKHKQVYDYLNSRYIAPRKVFGASIYPDKFPYDSLTKVPVKKGGKMNFWPSFWANKYPIAIPLYDVTGTVRTYQGRAILPDVKPSSRCPAFYSMVGLFFANQQMLQHIKKEEEHEEFWIVEGEIDFLTLASRLDVPVIGIKNGSIESFAYLKFPENCKIIIATDNDKAGNEYAQRIARHLLKYDFVRWQSDLDVNDYVRKTGGSLEGFRDCIEPIEFAKNIKAEEGIRKIKTCLRSMNGANKEMVTHLLFELMGWIDLLAYAEMINPDELERQLFKLAQIRGLGKQITSMKKQVAKRVREIEMEALHLLAGDDSASNSVDLLRKTVKGLEIIMQIERNVVNILQQDIRMNGLLKYNELKDATEYKGKVIEDSAVIDVMLFMQDNYWGFRMDKTSVGNCMNYVGEMAENRYNPARDMFDEIYTDTDVSFAPKRSNPLNLFTYYFRSDTKKNELYEAYAKYFLLSVINRIYEPGCRMESFPCLIGKQGAGKSSAIRALTVNEDFFSDTHFDIKNKDAKLQIKGNMIYEIAEGDSLSSSKATHALIKGFLTAKNFDYRKPYKSTVERVPNSHAFMITTNEDTIDFLSDKTGSRRFHAMMVGVGGDIRVDEIENDIKFIWAQALHMYWGTGPYEDVGPQKGFFLDKDLEEASMKSNRRFAEIDPWETYIEAYLYEVWSTWKQNEEMTERLSFLATEVFEDLKIPAERQTKKDSKRINDILVGFGCVKGGMKRRGDKRIQCWKIKKNLFN